VFYKLLIVIVSIIQDISNYLGSWRDVEHLSHREGREDRRKTFLHGQSWIYGLVRGLEDIEWRVMERISRAREAVRGERGWVESRDRTTSVQTQTRVRIIDVVLQAPWW